MLCPYCKIIAGHSSTKYLNLYNCKDCNVFFKLKNNKIQYLFLYYKNYRIYFSDFYPECQLHIKYKFLLWHKWQFILKLSPDIINKPINEIHKYLDSIDKLIVFM